MVRHSPYPKHRAPAARPYCLLGATLAIALGAGPAARAEPTFSFGGFGTLAAVHSGEHQADYTASPISPGQAGFGKQWAFDVDSRAGAQVGARFDRRWSAVVQVVQERGVERKYESHLEWANVKFQATPDLALRAGRIALPIFLTADYRKAGYALPWLRAPVELYSLMPITNSDGVDASYRWSGFGARHETQVMAGRAEVDIAEGVHGATDRIFAITHTATAGAMTVRATAARAQLKIRGAEPFFDAFRSFGPAGAALADRYDIAERNVVVLSAGFSYEPGDWFLMGEIGRINTRSLLGDQTAAYLSGGYRFGTVTPYATYARVDVNMATHSAGLPTDGLPPQAAELAALLNTELAARLHSIGVQDTGSLGVRWDFARNFAFKAQLDRVQPKGGSMGTLINVRPGFRSGQAFGVVSAGVDFVF
jgi:hypothetical protein